MRYYQTMYFGTKPYGLDGYLKNHGNGSNMYRTETFAQPRTLIHGDVLANGWQVNGDTFEGYNGRVGIKFKNGLSRLVAARLPLQLMSGIEGVLPGQLRIGQILQTGCVVLELPNVLGPVDYHQGQEEVEIKITGGRDGHTIGTPSDLELAVFEEEYPPSMGTQLGAFTLERALAMDESARANLRSIF